MLRNSWRGKMNYALAEDFSYRIERVKERRTQGRSPDKLYLHTPVDNWARVSGIKEMMPLHPKLKDWRIYCNSDARFGLIVCEFAKACSELGIEPHVC